MRQNTFAAGALTRTPLGELIALPDPVAGFEGGKKGEGGRKSEGWEGGRGRGEEGKDRTP